MPNLVFLRYGVGTLMLLRFEAARVSTPVYASHGGADGMVKVSWGRATAQKLKAKGLDLSFKEHSEMDHELGEEQARPRLRSSYVYWEDNCCAVVHTPSVHVGRCHQTEGPPSYVRITANPRKAYGDGPRQFVGLSPAPGGRKKEGVVFDGRAFPRRSKPNERYHAGLSARNTEERYCPSSLSGFEFCFFS